MAKKNKPEEPKGLKYTYFKGVLQRNGDGKVVLMAVLPDDFLGKELPTVSEIEACIQPKTIYTGTDPVIKVNPQTLKDISKQYKGHGLAMIATSVEWMLEVRVAPDQLGISLD